MHMVDRSQPFRSNILHDQEGKCWGMAEQLERKGKYFRGHNMQDQLKKHSCYSQEIKTAVTSSAQKIM